jgi:heptosyltransferase-2
MLNRLLVVKLADIGDLLTVTPTLRALRELHPNATIDLLATPHSAEVVGGLSSVDRLVLFQKRLFDSARALARPRSLAEALRLGARLRAGRYDAVLICHHLNTRYGGLKYAALALATGAPRRLGLDSGLGRAWFLTERAADSGFGAVHETDYWLRVAELLDLGRPIPIGRYLPEVSIGAEAEASSADLLPDGPGLSIAVHAGSGSFSVARRWPVERFAEVANALARRHGARIILVGGPDEVELTRRLAGLIEAAATMVAGRTTLPELAAVLRRCGLFVGNDSGLMHLAAAVRTPVVAVFGPTNERAWGPYGFAEWQPGMREAPPGVANLVVRVNLPCSPCLYRNFSLGNRLGSPGRECLALVPSSAVISAAEALLMRGPKPPTREAGPHSREGGQPGANENKRELSNQQSDGNQSDK